MAIDTRMKRFSMLNMATAHVYPALFEADGAVDKDDRAYLLHLYGGNTLDGGEGEVEEEVLPSGGFWFDYDGEQYRRKRERERLDELERKAEEIQNKLDREIALELRKQEKEESRLIELNMLTKLASEHREDIEKSFSDKVIHAANRAIMQGNYSAMEAFERQIVRLREEEEFIMMAAVMLINQ